MEVEDIILSPEATGTLTYLAAGTTSMTDTDASSGFWIRFAKNSVHNIAIKHYFKEELS